MKKQQHHLPWNLQVADFHFFVYIIQNVRHVIIPIVAKRIFKNIFNLYVSFLSHSPIKIVSQKILILPSLSQKLVSGFFQRPVL
jgi:hypothetical protein